MTPETYIFGQWANIKTILENETNYGDGGPGTGTNISGRLQTVASVAQSTWPDFESLPFVGVELVRVRERLKASERKHKFTSIFRIVGVVQVVATGDSLLKLEDAYASLRTIVDDGNGNGIMPILRDNANFNLGTSRGVVNADATFFPDGSDSTYGWNQSPVGKGTDYIAYVNVLLTTYKEVHVGTYP